MGNVRPQPLWKDNWKIIYEVTMLEETILSEITLSRSNEGADDTWYLTIGGAEVPSERISVEKGKSVVFTLPSRCYYTMLLDFTRTTYGKTFGSNVVPAMSRSWELQGRSNQWSGTLSPGKYRFECGSKFNLGYLSLKVITFGEYQRADLYLTMRSFHEQ
jgi:hypothetical protein